ncbi:MAG: hypothetical protein RQM95_01890 [Syntrophaceticus schinkii]
MDKQELEKLIKEKEYLFLKEKLEKTKFPLIYHNNVFFKPPQVLERGCIYFFYKNKKTLSVWQQTKN